MGNINYAPQKVENVQYHPKVEDTSTKIPACLNRQSSTLIYSSENGDLSMFNLNIFTQNIMSLF